jgi:hypothetical protein
MRARHVLSAAILAGLPLLSLSGCSFGVNVHDRITMFITDLNAADRSSINAEFDQALTKNLSLMDTAWWASNFPVPPDSDHLYSITLLDYSDPANVLATIMGPPAFNASTGRPRNAVLVMSGGGAGGWFIEKLFLDGSATALIQERGRAKHENSIPVLGE